MISGTLLQSGVELVKALEIAQAAVQNTLLRQTVIAARKRLVEGVDLASAMLDNHRLPPALIQVFALGQSSGQLDQLLLQISEEYDYQVATLADRLTHFLEPILIIGLSVIVGFILLGTLLPILETGNALSEST